MVRDDAVHLLHSEEAAKRQHVVIKLKNHIGIARKLAVCDIRVGDFEYDPSRAENENFE